MARCYGDIRFSVKDENGQILRKSYVAKTSSDEGKDSQVKDVDHTNKLVLRLARDRRADDSWCIKDKNAQKQHQQQTTPDIIKIQTKEHSTYFGANIRHADINTTAVCGKICQVTTEVKKCSQSVNGIQVNSADGNNRGKELSQIEIREALLIAMGYVRKDGTHIAKEKEWKPIRINDCRDPFNWKKNRVAHYITQYEISRCATEKYGIQDGITHPFTSSTSGINRKRKSTTTIASAEKRNDLDCAAINKCF